MTEPIVGWYAEQEIGHAVIDPLPPGDRMVYLDGSDVAFRCDCHCNVFRWIDTPRGRRLRCNSCDAHYLAE